MLIIDAETKDESGRLLCKNQFTTYINKAGGFGGKSRSDLATPLGKTPNRQPDKIVENITCLEQAALYRLSGDNNPLHIDPNFANFAGMNSVFTPPHRCYFQVIQDSLAEIEILNGGLKRRNKLKK